MGIYSSILKVSGDWEEMEIRALHRLGKLLGILNELSDVEHQIVLQVYQPRVFIPDQLIESWQNDYQSGYGLDQLGLSEDIQATLREFDYQLDKLMTVVPVDVTNKEHFIRHAKVWRVIREMAEFTISEIMLQIIPSHPVFGHN